MKKILLAEAIVLVVLVVAAIFVSVFVNGKPDPTGDFLQNTTGTTQVQTTTNGTEADTEKPTETLPPDPTQDTTAPASTEAPTQPPTQAPTQAQTKPAPNEFGIEARQYFVYDCESGEFLAISGEKSDKVYPASVTKLFSAFVALQYLDPEEVITAGDELDMVASDSSLAYIQKGPKLTVAMLVEGMLLPSGNDAAHILAAAAGRKAAGDSSLSAKNAVSFFVNMMNATANAMGMKNSHFSNPDGYHDDNHYTSLGDLSIIARLALDDPTISTCTKTYEDDVKYASGQTITWKNTNHLINPYSEYYISTAIGLKTGYTDEAGNCLMSAFRVGGRNVIIGVFGCPKGYGRFNDTTTLYEELVEN